MSTAGPRGGWSTPRRAAVRAGRVLVGTVVVATAMFGAVVTPWAVMLLGAPALGLLAAGTVASADPGFPREPGSRRVVVHVAAGGVLAVPFGAALPALGGLGGAVVLVVLVVGSLVAADALAAAERGSRAEDAAELGALPTEEVVRQWLATEERLRSPRHRGEAAEVRALLLDELARRDPQGVAAWLAAGGASPAPYIRTGRDLPG
ncbi:hypothetical protein DQ244_13920 [Blastococcus sp. TBT05-19]|uniref:hypothetical protein n=1 Tax=Blastococcus sp. TBT05-19 TaxID=2250581 RepID=UPI000DE92ADA|nr:hypothetical protein [Blastococcus sp. TBT05-19]RBY88894.1 hypothetical protein DQ244_13920 [Blastococcus sp. TBT05-19]